MAEKIKLTLRFLLNFYDAALRFKEMTRIADTLGINYVDLNYRLRTQPKLELAFQIAREKASRRTLAQYIFESLSKDAQKTWKKVRQAASLEEKEQVFELLKSQSNGNRAAKRVRQELFVYALVNSSFNLSKALSHVGISFVCLQKWKQDPEFMGLMNEIQFHKKNFYETALISLVEEGNAGATIFVNKTLNADRGYSEKFEIQTTDANQGFRIEDLNLPLDVKKMVLEAIRQQRQKALNGHGANGEMKNVTPVRTMLPAIRQKVIDVDETEEQEKGPKPSHT